jgi:hypothetical protein
MARIIQYQTNFSVGELDPLTKGAHRSSAVSKRAGESNQCLHAAPGWGQAS